MTRWATSVQNSLALAASAGVSSPGVQGLGGAVGDGLGGVHLGLAGGQLELRVLEVRDRLAEDGALLHVLLGEPDRGLGLGVGAEGDAPALGGQVVAEVVEALVLLAEQVLDGHLDVDERQLGGVGGLQAELVELAADRVALGLGVHGEEGDAVTAVLGGGGRGAGADDHLVGVHTAGDEGFGAVQDVVGAVLAQLGGGLHAREVGAGARLGHRDGPHLLAGDELRQEALLLLVGGEHLDVGQGEQHMHAGAAELDARAGGLLVEDGLELVGVHARAAVLLRHADAEDAQLAELVVEVAGRLARREPLVVDGDDLGLDEGADGLPERLVILVENRTAHCPPPPQPGHV